MQIIKKLQYIYKTRDQDFYNTFGLFDTQTGIKNRNGWEADKNNYSNISIVMLDLNKLKWTNDNLGHEQGDILINSLACQLRGLNSYRIGGDEFIIVFKTQGEAESKARSIYNSGVSVSIGLASGLNPAKVLKEADNQMYLMKTTGVFSLAV